MKRLAALLAVLGAMLGTALPAYGSTAVANQHPVGGSGIHGLVNFTDTGSSLVVTGTSTGLNPANHYFSLIYSLGTHPGGVSENKTLPPTSNAIPPCSGVNAAGVSTITTTQMVIGFWTVNADGTGTLSDTKSLAPVGNSQDPLFLALGLGPFFTSIGYVFFGDSYSPIGNWSTVSIRDADQNFSLVACGLVRPN